jgi:hypothetical protein
MRKLGDGDGVQIGELKDSQQGGHLRKLGDGGSEIPGRENTHVHQDITG